MCNSGAEGNTHTRYTVDSMSVREKIVLCVQGASAQITKKSMKGPYLNDNGL